MDKIPPKGRKEWSELLNGQLEVKLSNFFFQMKVTNAKSQVKEGKVTIAEAVDEIYSLCEKYYKASNMPEDLQKIFKIELDPKTRNLVL